MTDRLYYNDAYLTQFQATVTKCVRSDSLWHVSLDRTAFYPTSGGQPFDTGVLGGANVSDVYVDQSGEVWHVVDAPLSQGERVEGAIDWARRFDHMQQHAGEHMIAGKIFKMANGHTIGLHLGAEVSTIDVSLPGGEMRLEEDLLREIETWVNADIQRDIPIRCFFPTPEEMAALPLRKPPTVREHIRVVLIGEECVACGGTHPASTGQIGLVKILDARPSRGKMRVSFVCGMRAIRDYQMRFEVSGRAAARLSSPVEKLDSAAQRALDRLDEAEYRIKAIYRREAMEKLDGLIAGAKEVGKWRLVVHRFDGLDMDSLRDLASALTQNPDVIALLAVGHQQGEQLLFASSEQTQIDMSALLREAARAFDGKGGGKPCFAQGSAPRAGALEYAARKTEERLQAR